MRSTSLYVVASSTRPVVPGVYDMFPGLIHLAFMLASPGPLRTPLPLQPYPQLISTRFTEKDGLSHSPISEVRVDGRKVLARLAAGDSVSWMTLNGGKWDFAQAPVEPEDTALIQRGTGSAPLSMARTRAGGLWTITAKGA